jgi:hypothetical protein
MLPQSYSTKPSRRTRRVPAPDSPSQPVDGLEGPVLLNDGEEDLGWRILERQPQVYRPRQDAA